MATVSKEESITKAADRIKLIVLLALLIFSGYDLAHANLENCFSEKELSTVVDVNRRGLVDAMVIISTNHRYDELTGKFYDPLNQYDSSFVLYSLFLHSYRIDASWKDVALAYMRALKELDGPKTLFGRNADDAIDAAIACISAQKEDCAKTAFESGRLKSLRDLSGIKELRHLFREFEEACKESFPTEK